MALHFILDGYNIIKNDNDLADLSLENGRNKFVRILENQRPQGSVKNKVTVVFDGQPGAGPFHNSGPVHVVFSSGQTADDVIKNIVSRARNKKAIVVVTNDRAIQYYVRSLGARILNVREFWPSRLKAPDRPGKPGKKAGKHIPKSVEVRINDELMDIWLNRDINTNDRKSI